MYSIWPFIFRWNAVNNFVSIPNILFSFLASYAANCKPLSNITLSDNPYNFHTLFLNNLTNLSADIPSTVATKCTILDNLLQTIRVTLFPATNSSLVIKSTMLQTQVFRVRQVDKPCIGLTQENLIENSV